MKLFFGVNDLNDAAFESDSHDSSIRSDAKCAHIVAEGGYLFGDLIFDGVVDVESSSVGVDHELLGVAIGRDSRYRVGEGRELFSFVLLPEALFVGEFVLGLG